MKRNAAYIPLLMVVLFMNIFPAFSQRATFNYIKPPDIDPWAIVISIAQDSQGYMWFAGNGIHRYDGINTISYRNDPLNPNSLISNAAESLFADDNNSIWIGTQGAGMDRFDIIKKTFTHYRHQDENENSISAGTIAAITKDREGNIWIGTGNGLDRLEPKTGKFIHYRYKEGDSTSLSNNQVRAVYVDKQDVVWVGTGSPFHNDNDVNNKSGGLNRLDKKTNKFTRYIHNDNDPFSLVDNRVRAIYEDSRGVFWIGTAGDGLHSLDRLTGKFKRYPYDPVKISRPHTGNRYSWVDDHITFINEDDAGSLWIGTMMGGMTKYNPETGIKIEYGTGKDSTNNYPDNSAWTSYSSRDGIFWISTWQKGLYRINPFQQTFPYYNMGEHVHGVYKEDNGDNWICTHHGLVKTDAAKKVIKKYLVNMESGDENINDFKRDRAGVFWIATREGLVSFNPLTEKTTIYTHDDADKNSLSHSTVISIFEDHNGDLWLGTFDGLNKLDRKTGKFIHYKDESKIDNTFSRKITPAVIEDHDRNLWAGTYDGVNRVDPVKGVTKNYLKGLSVYTIFEASDNTLWVGASEGLFQYQPAADSFTVFSDPASGLGYKNVYVIFEDHQRRLWLSPASNVIRFNERRDSSIAFEDGFGLKNITIAGPVLNSKDKEIFLSDHTGYYNVLPDKVTGNFIPATVTLTDFRVGEQSMLTIANNILPNGFSPEKKIDLSYKQNVFSFDFDVLHFGNSQDNQCLYKLENYDEKWRQPGIERTASYFNVPPGHYIFRVKGASSNGIWVEKSIEIIISPPWWETWTFRILSVIALVVVVYSLIKERSRKLEAENLRLEKNVLERTAQLKKSLEDLKSTQAQLIQAEKMASLGELTAGIAHEIQNPLNFVNNFSDINKELIDELKSQKEKLKTGELDDLLNDIASNEEKINHHGKRADAIVKGMLQHTQSGKGQTESTDINALADEYLRLSYHGLRAKDKSFNAAIKTNFDNSIGKINIIPQDIGRVLLNLYNNAFYAVDEKAKQLKTGFEPTVSVTSKKINDTIEIKVSDNGNGIPQAIIDKIFQPFFTTKPTGQGTGLGLSLAYDIVKAHGGEIKVESNEKEGTTFIIQLPTA